MDVEEALQFLLSRLEKYAIADSPLQAQRYAELVATIETEKDNWVYAANLFRNEAAYWQKRALLTEAERNEYIALLDQCNEMLKVKVWDE